MRVTLVRGCTASLLGLLPPVGQSASLLLLLVAGLECLLVALREEGLITNERISITGRLALVSLLPLLWLNLAWCLYWYARICRRLRRFPHDTHHLVETVVRAVAATVVAGGTAVYLIGWGFFWRTGVFPDTDVIRFSIINSQMLIRYLGQAEPRVFVLLLGVAVLSVLAARFVFRFGSIGTGPGRRRLATWIPSAGAALVGLNAVASTMILVDADASLKSATRPAAYREPFPPLRYEVSKHLNPLVALASSCFAYESSDDTGEIATDVLIPRTAVRPVKSASGAGDQPNCVLMVVESLRADVIDMVHQGQEIVPTINMLARDGLHFTRCYSQSVHSDYADPCIVSSLYPLRDSRQYFYTSSVAWPKVNLWDVLKPYGYSTAMFSSQNEAWSNMHLFYSSRNLDVLFDARSAPTASSTFDDPILADWVNSTGSAGKLDDSFTRQQALWWAAGQRRRQEPFLLVVNFQSSHFPYRLAKDEGPFRPGTIDFPASIFGYPEEKVPVVRNAYFNALRYIDAQIKEIVAAVDEAGTGRKTLIVITGDHGEAFHEVGEVGHAQSLLETTCRVPLILYGPGMVPEGQDDYLAQAIDIAPTILGTLEIDVPEAFQGIDLLAANRSAADQRMVFLHSRAGGIGCDAVVTASGWKYVADHDAGRARLLFRPTDLQEEQDLSSSFPGVVAVLDSLLMTWRRHQIAFYRQSRYHELFYAPRTPELSERESAGLFDAAARAAGEHRQATE